MIKLTGYNLPRSFSVIIGDVIVDVISSNENYVIFKSPPMEPGFYNITIKAEILGNFK
jgi:hypothetical protein